MNIQQNIPLKDYTTFKIGGEAKYFVVVKDIEDLKQAVSFAKQNSLPVFVLGGGSNLLVSDKGVNGLVIKMEITDGNRVTAKRSGVSNPVSGSNFVQVTAGAGETWDNLVAQTVEKGLSGLENLSGIPGTVGAGVVGNIGAYGTEIKDVVDWVEIFDIEKGKVKKITNKECNFSYRDSIFKKEKNWIVVRVAFSLFFVIASAKRVAIQALVCEANSLKEKRKEILKTRESKLPDWKKIGTAGSFFKNPTVNQKQLNNLLKKYPELPGYLVPHGALRSGVPGTQMYKIPLAYILDKILNLKGHKEGGVGLYKNQPLVLVSHKNATAKEIKTLAQKIQSQVKQKTDLDIDFEVVVW